MIAKVNGIELFYEKTGTGRPLVMVHGNGEDHKIFDKAVEVLQEHFTCYLVDSRGHGESSSTEEFHYQDMAEDMIAFLELLQLESVIFYGFSDGGIIGLLAAMKTDRISHLIVSGANASVDGAKRWVYQFMKIGYFFKKDPKVKLMLTEPNMTDAQLRTIKAKTLVLAGSKDVIREEHTRYLAENIPDSQLRILAGEGHGSYIVHSEKIANYILEFAK